MFKLVFHLYSHRHESEFVLKGYYFVKSHMRITVSQVCRVRSHLFTKGNNTEDLFFNNYSTWSCISFLILEVSDPPNFLEAYCFQCIYLNPTGTFCTLLSLLDDVEIPYRPDAKIDVGLIFFFYILKLASLISLEVRYCFEFCTQE